MSNLKWADVAHMYVNSKLRVKYEREADLIRGEAARSGEFLYSMLGQLNALGSMMSPPLPPINYTPILRHLEDMPPSEIIECLMLSWPEQTMWTVKSYETFPDHSIFGHAFRYKIEFNENPPSSCCGTLSFNSLCPKQFHWCYGRGFDMNRLIEAGEAIRAEKLGDGSTKA